MLRPLERPGTAWVALAALLAAGSVFATALPAALLDWQPARAAAEPWRAWTAAFVHWSAPHLGANLLAAGVVALFGWAARLPWAHAVAWSIAWPLTQCGLWLQPALLHFGGLSGVLHAGVAVGACAVAQQASGRSRAVGLCLLAGMATKIVLEAPWGAPLRDERMLDIAVAPLAHATGAVSGLLCAGAATLWQRRRGRLPRPD